MPRLKLGLLVLAAAILPSCDYHHHPNRVRISVDNLGEGSAEVRSEAEYSAGLGGWEDQNNYTVASGQTVESSFKFDNLERLNIWIYRSKDGLKLFEESWSRHQLEDLDRRVIIAVSP